MSPNRDVLALYERRGDAPLADLAAPMLRLAGTRLNPQTNGPHRAALSAGLVLMPIAIAANAPGAPAGAPLRRSTFTKTANRSP